MILSILNEKKKKKSVFTRTSIFPESKTHCLSTAKKWKNKAAAFLFWKQGKKMKKEKKKKKECQIKSGKKSSTESMART